MQVNFRGMRENSPYFCLEFVELYAVADPTDITMTVTPDAWSSKHSNIAFTN